jgi:hypothetical protein
MKKYIYIVLFAILLLYINSHSKCLNEKFTDTKKFTNITAPSPYNVLKTNKVKPILIEGNSELVPGYDINSNDIYSEKYWIIKSKGFSDIYNYEDESKLHLFLNNSEDQTNKKVVQETNKKVVQETNKNKQEKISGPPKTHKYENNDYNLIATASNDYYNQYYYLYEYLTKQNVKLDYEENLKYITNNQVYEYLLVKIRKNKLEVSHYIGPRNKININDIVYFSLGNFQLGPLKIKKL